MAEIRPFRGWRFNPGKVGALDHVVTPPYDVISTKERATLATDPHSYVHVILPESNGEKTKYQHAREVLDEWTREGALRKDDSESFYLLRQTFTDLEGRERVRRGFFAVTRLPEEGEKIILGHERTFDKPVEDRLRLTEATEANLGPVFVMYSNTNGALDNFLAQMDARTAEISANTIDGVHQELWRVDPAPEVAALIQDQKLYIADGHHRFRTAQLYRQQQRDAGIRGDQPHDFVLMGFIAFEDPGLAIFPPHRVVRSNINLDPARLLGNLGMWFEVEAITADEMKPKLDASDGTTAIGFVDEQNDCFILRLRESERVNLLGEDRHEAWRDLDVAVLHRGILEHILGVAEGTEFEYEKDFNRALNAVEEKRGQLAFLLRPTRPEQVKACAEAEEPMPQKSTYFFPKLPSGAVFYRFKD